MNSSVPVAVNTPCPAGKGVRIAHSSYAVWLRLRASVHRPLRRTVFKLGARSSSELVSFIDPTRSHGVFLTLCVPGTLCGPVCSTVFVRREPLLHCGQSRHLRYGGRGSSATLSLCEYEVRFQVVFNRGRCFLFTVGRFCLVSSI